MKNKPRILIADDDPSSFIMLSEIAKAEVDIECDHASDGQQAIDLAKEHDYFLIFLDYMMPGMDGIQCAKNIAKSLASPPPIIFISGLSDNQEVKKSGYQLGAVDYLTKPVDPEALASKVTTFYRLHQSHHEIKEHLETEKAKHSSTHKLLDHSGEGIIGFNIDLIIDYVNVAASTMLTAEVEDLIGTSIKEIMHKKMSEDAWWQSDFVLNFLEGQNAHIDSATFWRPSGDFFPVSFTETVIIEDGKISGGILAFQDATERMMIERQLKDLSSKDQLTNLLNRKSFYEALHEEVSTNEVNLTPFSLFFIDVDNFKAINDNFGHVTGDKLLASFSQRLIESFPPSSILSRLGGDEFAILVRMIDRTKLQRLAEQIICSLKKPHTANNHEIYCSVSIGIALCPENADEVTQLVSAADTAMYLAKQNGKDSFCFFDKSAQQKLTEKFQVAVNLRKADYNKEFTLLFQPKFNLKTLKMAGAEALIRWNSPTLGNVSPELFIGVAESSGYINDITQWVIKQAVKQTKSWNETSQLTIPLRVAINASPLDIKRGTFVKQVLDAIYIDKLNPTWLELEVTESALMDDPEAAIAVLKKLKQHGIRVSVDDFGTGYSSLNYLKVLPINYLKIDQSFVQDIGVDVSDEKIIKAIIQLAHSLDLKVIAEGIETEEQLRYLQALDCDYGQGFLFSTPVEAKDIPRLFR